MLIQEKPRVSIIICTYNRADLLRITLESLSSLQDIEKAEVLIVDNNSSDHTRSVADAFIKLNKSKIVAHYCFELMQGLSAARNTGIHAAEGDIIAFLDDDAVPCEEWIITILTTFDSRRDVYAMGGIIYPNFESGRPAWLIKALELPYTIVDNGRAVKEYPPNLHPFGANMAIRKSFLENHLFPTHLGRKGTMLLSGEESWLFNQMKKEGKTILYHPHMSVVHFIPDSRLTREWIQERYYYQGITNGAECKGIRNKLRLLSMIAARVLYIVIDSLFARSEGRKLLNKCRLESIRGTLDMMRCHGNMPIAG